MHPDCQPDDPSISDSEPLLRRIHPDNVNPQSGMVVPDAFDDFECSVEIKSKSSPQRCLAYLFSRQVNFANLNDTKRYEKFFKKGWRVASIFAQIPRALNQTVYPDVEKVQFKDIEITNDAHALICGQKDDEVLYELAKNAVV